MILAGTYEPEFMQRRLPSGYSPDRSEEVGKLAAVRAQHRIEIWEIVL